ncbi:DNA-directed RNA polymerases I, II, and III subunit RPABC3 [Dispira simplex]|nr:DNA-directed RNA polymerases I, II, and III subunit RPABC3 [Dispira simplex]KAJ1654072.1 DNA-directed RNA polymerases I, II, and III subunit RPABC3 [Dispira simplex]
MSSKDGILFSDIFDIEDIDKDGKKFDRVSRLFAKCDSNDAKVILDYNVELYPLEIGDRFTLTLASTLSLTGESGAGGQGVKKESWRPNQTEKTLADEYEYVMHGKVYRYDDAHESSV